jgi:hypothetical protein
VVGAVLLHDLVRSRMRTAPSPTLSIAAAVALSNPSQVVFFSVTKNILEKIFYSKAQLIFL